MVKYHIQKPHQSISQALNKFQNEGSFFLHISLSQSLSIFKMIFKPLWQEFFSSSLIYPKIKDCQKNCKRKCTTELIECSFFALASLLLLSFLQLWVAEAQFSSFRFSCGISKIYLLFCVVAFKPSRFRVVWASAGKPHRKDDEDSKKEALLNRQILFWVA